ncbi:MAG: hypothetical protein AB7O62_18395 [Pirellulales bacterium]
MAKHPHKSRGSPAIVVAVVVVLLLGYVLSIGPAGRAGNYEAWSSAYAPLLWITDRMPVVRKLMRGYLKLWGASIAAELMEVRAIWRETWNPPSCP